MESDLSAIKESGGAAPEPKPFTPSEFKPQAPVAPQKPAETKLNVPGYTGPEEAIFNPASTLPQAGGGTPEFLGGAVPEAAGGKKWLKPALLGGGGLVALVGLGLVGYYFVYPLLFPAATPVPPPQPPAPVATTTPEVAPPAPAVEPHKTFFVIPAEKTETLKITSADTALSLRAALDGMGKDVAAPGSAKEVLVVKEDDSPESFARTASMLVPELPEEATLKTIFRDDFTLALYFDANGAWPVYIAQLQTGTNLLDAQAALAGFERSPNLANLYPTDPGAKSTETFNDGSVSGKPTRYLPFTKQGASLNYGWLDNFLVISTSYDALKDAVRRLGL